MPVALWYWTGAVGWLLHQVMRRELQWENLTLVGGHDSRAASRGAALSLIGTTFKSSVQKPENGLEMVRKDF